MHSYSAIDLITVSASATHLNKVEKLLPANY